MILKLEGKQHYKGVNKSGNDYDFCKIHVLMPDNRVTGKAAVTKNIYDSGAFDKLVVGCTYDFQTDFDGNITGFTPAKV